MIPMSFMYPAPPGTRYSTVLPDDLPYPVDMVRYTSDTALVIVDVQNDFASPNGSLSVAGAEAIIPRINAEITDAKAAGASVVYTRDWHPESTPHFAKDGGIWPVHCVANTWGAGFHPGLVVGGPEVRKGSHGEDGYSGFTMRDPATGSTVPTELDTLLDGVSRIVIAGLATDYCVKETALDGIRLGYDVTVLRDAVRSVDLHAGDGERAIAEVIAAGGRVE
jgi:nicotinamidase/pyrazinamidase